MTRIAAIGGGIGGMALSLFLGRRGHSVTVLEREGRGLSGRLDEDFFSWRRPNVPQAIQPHVLLAPVRTVLKAEAPDVYGAMLRLGAEEFHEFEEFTERPPARPGDDDLVRLQARRIVLEAALAQAIEREPSVTVLRGDPAVGLLMERGEGVPRVTGVRSVSGEHHADLVVDAAGRRSPVVDWLSRAGCQEVPVESHRIGIAYFNRWYRLRPDGPSRPARCGTASFSPFALAVISPSDNDTFAVTLTVSTTDATRSLLRDPETFERVARTFPAAAAWLALEPEAISDIDAMGSLDNRWTSLVSADGPVVTGLVGVGDCVTHTNPTLSQGVALTLLAAQWVARHVEDASRDRMAFVEEYHRWTMRTLRPWFEAQAAADRAHDARLGGPWNATGGPLSEAAREKAARIPCAFDDPVVMRARAKVRHLVATEEEAYGTEEVRTHVARWLKEHPDFTPTFDGPTRDEWERVATGA